MPVPHALDSPRLTRACAARHSGHVSNRPSILGGSAMGLRRRLRWAACLLAAGCATTPPLDNPVAPSAPRRSRTPFWFRPGVPTREAYREVFEKTDRHPRRLLRTAAARSVRRADRDEAADRAGIRAVLEARQPGHARPAPGHLPDDSADRVAEIRAGERGGILVHVVVDRELEDLARPSQARVGNAVFQEIRRWTGSSRSLVETPQRTRPGSRSAATTRWNNRFSVAYDTVGERGCEPRTGGNTRASRSQTGRGQQRRDRRWPSGGCA